MGVPPLIAVEAIAIMVARVAVFLGPVAALVALWFLVDRIDGIIAWLFPHLQWEKDLGWLNIKAERRAQTALRLLGAAFYLFLAAALIAIAYSSSRIADDLAALPNPAASIDLMIRLSVVVLALGVWTIYFSSYLLPKIRAEREEKQLRAYRATAAEDDRERESRRPRKSPQPIPQYKKPRANSGFDDLLSPRRRRMPGE